MIELKISGCCKNCDHIDLDTKESTLFSELIGRKAYSIRCIHEPVCAALEKELSDGKADENIQST